MFNQLNYPSHCKCFRHANGTGWRLCVLPLQFQLNNGEIRKKMLKIGQHVYDKKKKKNPIYLKGLSTPNTKP